MMALFFCSIVNTVKSPIPQGALIFVRPSNWPAACTVSITYVCHGFVVRLVLDTKLVTQGQT